MALIAPGTGNRSNERQPDPGQEAGLSVWTDQSANRCVLRLRGRLCADTVKLLDTHVDLLLCRWCDEVVMDLDGLTTLDVAGARLLVGFGHYMTARGGRFRLTGARAAHLASLEAAEVELAG